MRKNRKIPTVRDAVPIEPRISEIRKSEMAEMVDRMQSAATAAPSTGLCPAGKHGLDYPGQPCDLCPSRPTLAAALTPRTQAESWAVLAALRMFVEVSDDLREEYSRDAETKDTLRAMLARGEGLE